MLQYCVSFGCMQTMHNTYKLLRNCCKLSQIHILNSYSYFIPCTKVVYVCVNSRSYSKPVNIHSKNLDVPTHKKQTSVIGLTNGLKPYLKLSRLEKPIGTWLLFWPCGWSIALAADATHFPDFKMLGLFAAGSLIMRSAGCTINDLWDKNIDRNVSRTKNRPLANGDINNQKALAFLSVQLSVGLAILLQLNWYSIILGSTSLILVLFYPLMKRVTYWPQVFLGMTFNWGALLGYSAVQGHIYWAACLPLYMAGIFWTIIYDTIYAHQDRMDDLAIGLKSTAIKFGNNTKLWLTGFTTAMTGSLIMTGLVCHQTVPYYVAVFGALCHLCNQIYTLDVENPAECERKFKSNSYVGFILFCGIVLGTLLKENPANCIQVA